MGVQDLSDFSDSELRVVSAHINPNPSATCSHSQSLPAEVKPSGTTTFIVSHPSSSLLASMSTTGHQCAMSWPETEVRDRLFAVMDAVRRSEDTRASMQAIVDAFAQTSPSALEPSSLAIVTGLLALHCSSCPPPLVKMSPNCFKPLVAPSDIRLPETQPFSSCTAWEQHFRNLTVNIRVLKDRLASKQTECEQLRQDVFLWQDRFGDRPRQEEETTTTFRQAQGEMKCLEKGKHENKRRRSA